VERGFRLTKGAERDGPGGGPGWGSVLGDVYGVEGGGLPFKKGSENPSPSTLKKEAANASWETGNGYYS